MINMSLLDDNTLLCTLSGYCLEQTENHGIHGSVSIVKKALAVSVVVQLISGFLELSLTVLLF